MSLYTISSQKDGHAKFKEAQLLMFDRAHWEDFEESDLLEHFHSIRNLFIQKIDALDQSGYVLDDAQEKELQFMFESLVQVKHAIQKTAVTV